MPTSSLLLLLIPKLAREHAAAEGAVVEAYELMPILPEDQEVLRVDFGDDGAIGELIGLRVARQVAVHQLVELGTTSHFGPWRRGHFRRRRCLVKKNTQARMPVPRYWIVLAPSTPMSLGITFRLMCRSRRSEEH